MSRHRVYDVCIPNYNNSGVHYTYVMSESQPQRSDLVNYVTNNSDLMLASGCKISFGEYIEPADPDSIRHTTDCKYGHSSGDGQ
jgi:hypothetical protein